MEKQTPITISSKSSALTLSSQVSPRFLQCVYDKTINIKSGSPNAPSEEESLRCPVTWNGPRKKLDILGLKTPSITDRVSEWMGINEFDKVTFSQHPKGSILVRCDFNKVVKDDDMVTECNANEVTPLYSYLERNMKAKSAKRSKELEDDRAPVKKLQRVTYQEYDRHLLQTGIASTNLVPNVEAQVSIKNSPKGVYICDTLSTTEEESASRNSFVNSPQEYEVPLSPESQKKELCTYLQLMNPADKKETLLLTNRRSVRVKNLNLLLEKKQLEQQLRQQTSTNEHSELTIAKKHKPAVIDLTETDDSLDNFPTLKSLKELNLQKFVPSFGQSKEKKFSFPKLPLQALKEVDFDGAIERVFENLNGSQPTCTSLIKLNGHKNSDGSIKLSETVSNTDCNEITQTNTVKSIMSKQLKPLPKSKVQNKVRKLNRDANSKCSYKNKSSKTLKMKKQNKRKLFRNISREKIRSLRSRNKASKPAENLIVNTKLRSGRDRMKLIKKKIMKTSNRKKTYELSKENVEKKNTENEEIRSEEKCDRFVAPSCEIIAYDNNHDDESLELKNFMDDLSDLDGLSEEHRRCLIESRILSTKSPHIFKSLNQDKINKIIQDNIPPSRGLSHSDVVKVRECFDTYRNMLKSPGISSSKTLDVLSNDSDSESSVEFINWKVDYSQSPVKSRFEAKREIISDTEASSNAIGNSLDFGKVSKPYLHLSHDHVDDEFNLNEIHSSSKKLLNNEVQMVNNRYINVARKSVSPTPVTNISEDSCSSTVSTSASGSDSSSDDIASLKSSVLPDHDYVESFSEKSDNGSRCPSVEPLGYQEVNTEDIETKEYHVNPLKKPSDMKTLHKSLTHIKRKSISNYMEGNVSDCTWESDVHETTDKQKSKTKNTLSHSISISKENGSILKAFYIDYNLIICQEYQVAFWTRSALGNVLGAQNMWIPKGKVQRLVLNDNSVQKDSAEMVISMESNIAYAELWTKEHKSDIREGPVADIFAIIYFWKQGQLGLDKKVLQLENINGFGDDVQYVVLKSTQKIIVTWHSVTETCKSTYIHSYDLAADYQTVDYINEMEPVKHYVSSLHNIEDCENLIMGCGENKITLWNLDQGYVVATIELNEIKSPLLTLWVKCDRGFLFTLQQYLNGELRLIAINGMNQSWKRLQSYHPPTGFDRLKGVSIENGILVSFYEQGILCWNTQNGEPVVEEIPNETEYIPSGKHVIMNLNGKIIVRHALTHLVISDES